MKNKGVTIIEMVIVVIILILLAIMAIWASQRPSLQAEVSAVFSELKAVHMGLLKVHQEYELEIFNDYTKGEHYNDEYRNASGDIVDDWYILYGITKSGDNGYSEKIMDNLGIDEIKRDYKINFETAEVEFLNGPVKVGQYEINSYTEIKDLIESGAI